MWPTRKGSFCHLNVMQTIKNWTVIKEKLTLCDSSALTCIALVPFSNGLTNTGLSLEVVGTCCYSHEIDTDRF